MWCPEQRMTSHSISVFSNLSFLFFLFEHNCFGLRCWCSIVQNLVAVNVVHFTFKIITQKQIQHETFTRAFYNCSVAKQLL